MKVLVTGAPGWLGSRLVERILDEDLGQVKALVAPDVDAGAIEKLGATAQRADLRDAVGLRGICDGIQTVFHVAGLVHAKRRTSEFFELNSEGTKNLLDEALSAGVKRFILVSSNSVGGVQKRRLELLSESDPPRPYMAYGRSKLLAEQYVTDAGRRGELETVILRPCWFYGPGQPDRQTRFFRMIKNGRPIVFGDGQNLRSMSYVDNTVDALIGAARAEGAAGQTYWVADETPYPTIEIYETVARILGVKDFRPRHLPGLVSDACRVADRVIQRTGFYQTEIHVAGEMNQDIACSIEKAKRDLGYRPRVSLEEGMRRSVDWCLARGIEL